MAGRMNRNKKRDKEAEIHSSKLESTENIFGSSNTDVQPNLSQADSIVQDNEVK